MEDLVPVKKNRVSEKVVGQIQRLIYMGRFKPGERLSSERELCKSLNVSKTSLREALFILQTMGYIHIEPRNGIYVKSPIPDTMPQPIQRMFKIGPEQLIDILETLEGMAPKVVSLAAERATPEDLEEMEEILSKFKGDLKRGNLYSTISGRSYNMQIYSLFAQACKNPLLAHLMNFTIEFIKGSLPFKVEDLDDFPDFADMIYKQLEEILFFIRDGDSKNAEEKVKEHLSFIKKCLRQIIDKVSVVS